MTERGDRPASPEDDSRWHVRYVEDEEESVRRGGVPAPRDEDFFEGGVRFPDDEPFIEDERG